MLTLLSFAAHAADLDRDTVQDAYDHCLWSDDRVDLNQDGIADCSQSMIPDGTFDVYSDILHWSAINAGTFRNTDPLDLFGYGYSDSMLAEFSGAGSAEVGSRICVPIGPPYANDTVAVWLQATQDAVAGSSPAYTELRQYSSSNCTTGNSVTVSDNYTIYSNAISLSDTSTTLLTSTRSVLLIAKSQTAAQFLVDNVLLLRTPGSLGGGGIDPENP